VLTTAAGIGDGTASVGGGKTFGRISTMATRGMPSFGSGPIKARSKRFGSASFGTG
jgi:hypothetical protein